MSKADANTDIPLIAYSIAQAAAALGIDKERVSVMARVGAIPHVRIGQRNLIGVRALEQWMTEQCLANLRHSVEATPTPLRRPRTRRATVAHP